MITGLPALWTLALLAIAASPAAPQPGQTAQVTFTDYPALARNSEIVRRTLSPLSQEIIRRRLAASRTAMAEHSVDLTKARFVVYLPSRRPAAGYGLIVFVPPSDDAKLPSGWAAVLDRSGFIYVSATASGNDQAVLTTRIPLALIAAGELLQRYEIDPARIYVGGFSGGSRTALRIALAYPDVFHGVLLNAGSDPIGEPPDILPPADLFSRFQASRVVFVTGALDLSARASDANSAQSMSSHCVFNVRTIVVPATGHAVAASAVFSDALDSLQRDSPREQGRLEACRAAFTARLGGAVSEARALVAAGRGVAARTRILALDRSFGGLAAEQIIDLAGACACGLLPEDGRK
jgi:predicted esterase